MAMRLNALMDSNDSRSNHLNRQFARYNCRANSEEADQAFEWGTEFFTFYTLDLEVENAHRVIHYEQRALFFHWLTTDRRAVIRYTGHEYSIFLDVLRNDRVMESLQASKEGYYNCPPSYPRCPISKELM